MMRIAGVVSAALTALIIGLAPIPSAQAAPALTGSGGLIQETVPAATEQVRWRGRRVYVARPYRPYRYRHYRPYRPIYHRPAYYRPAYYGPRCVWRPARTVWTPYGWRVRPAARICRY